MPAIKRHKTEYPGVYWIQGAGANGSPERIYYIMYRKDGRLIEERAGRQYRDEMTPAGAAGVRAERMAGRGFSGRVIRSLGKARKENEKERWTIDRLWNEYKLHRRPRGIVTDENRYKNHIASSFGGKEPEELTSLDIERLRIGLLKKLKPQTVKHVLALLSRIINFGVKMAFCKGLSFRIEMPKVENKKTEELTPEQLQDLLKVIEEDPHREACNMMLMALYTGMRRNELIGLRWKDIDFNRSVIRIRDLKGGAGRFIPLNDGARSILESFVEMESEYVFPGKDGGPLKRLTVLPKIRDRAGLPKDFRPLHGLRHVYASMLASSGQVDMFTLQRLMAHKSPAMTQRYAHLRDEALKRASGLAGDLINQALHGQKQILQVEDKKG